MRLQPTQMTPVLKFGIPFILLIVGFVGCNFVTDRRNYGTTRTVSIGKFAFNADAPAIQRTALQRLSQEITARPEVSVYKVQWEAVRDGKSYYPEIVYKKDENLLIDGRFEYSNVTPAAIHLVASKKDAIVGLSEYGGAKQTFIAP